MDPDVLKRIRALGGEDILTAEDLSDLRDSTVRVLKLMGDGEWHTQEEIKVAAGENGNPASEGLRRLRELREFFDVEKARDLSAKRKWKYRLKFKGRLF